ncbi:MAG: acyltransferase [Gammaproteobacteria bacterium]|nr:acyltransferase [Gammaproteobacteria bacterium]
MAEQTVNPINNGSRGVKKPLLRRVCNRLFQLLARFSPGATTLRPFLHRLRGVAIGRDVFIGDDVYIDNEYPEAIEIGENVQISIRSIIIAHTRGPGKVIIGKEAFIGPNSVLVCGAGRVLKIGEGAVIGAGSVITRSVPPKLYVAPPAPQPLARVRVPLPVAKSMQEFWSGLDMLDKQGKSNH